MIPKTGLRFSRSARGKGSTATRRIAPDDCLGAIIDVQEFFLAQADKRLRPRITSSTGDLVRLLGYFKIPLLVTLERPVARKGGLPAEIAGHLGETSNVFEKDFFDLTKEGRIRNHLRRLKKRQVIVAGCETDVCVLQSCLGLIGLGYEVFLVEDLVFSSAGEVDAAIARMRAEGAVLLTYKSLYYELIEAVEGGRHAQQMLARLGPFPDEIPDSVE